MDNVTAGAVPVRCRHGDFFFPDDAYIGKGFAMYGEYSEAEVQFLLSLVRPGDVVVDAGANVGALSIPLAKVCGNVFAFEPQSAMSVMLAANVHANNLDGKVDVICGGLSDETGFMRYDANDWNTGAVSLGTEGEHEVRVAPLDSLGLERLDLLKVDVEGMETQVLRGARRTVERLRPLLYIENDRPLNVQRVIGTIFSLGYRIWQHNTPLYNPANHRGVAVNIWPRVVAINLICSPVEREPPPQVRDLIEIKAGARWVAVARFGGVGDNLVAAAVLPELKRQGYKVEVITSDYFPTVFENNPNVDKLSVVRDGDLPTDAGANWQAWFEKRSHEYAGGLHHLSHSMEMTLAFVGAQTQFWWPPEVRRRVAGKSYLEMASDICGTEYRYERLFYPTDHELAKAAETKAKMGPRVVGWVLCGSRLDKVYPQSPWAIARIIKEIGVPVMMIGRPGIDFELAKRIQADVQKQNGSDAGLHLALSHSIEDQNWPLRRSLTQMICCDLVVGPDTGGMWAVAMEPMPKVVLLSHASPENITKHWVNTTTLHASQGRVPCWPCHRLHDSAATCVMNEEKTGAACISDISVDALLMAVREALP